MTSKRMNDEALTDAVAGGQDEIPQRLGKLEAWVEVVMRTLATLGLENLLIELDEARCADFEDAYFGEDKKSPRAEGPGVVASARTQGPRHLRDGAGWVRFDGRGGR